ncbi:MAG: S8 family serine peptidase, partial [Planctomycetota bacterium]
VVDTYGFDGSGQTVVVIDSGIAWSHTALGGGLGEGYRVVGGWDFTENDADPYDDGPGGRSAAHGTHVAGIIGASGDGAHEGVATGVDLVGLRVFDDAGNGYFSWVEQALDWVYTNRNAFENDITAVNLSLGTSWNSDSNPSWAMLEDEFAALEAEGIFISVSAGNDFTTYNEQGVSYPASSDHVIPVMSVDNNGSLSYFSQRATYAIGAPGRWITSTVPDYAANDGDTIDDDWLSMSGTSMAAPYVAGASVLVREAMEFVGQTGIDQWDLYNHMMSTADSFFDSATNATYKRLNLQAAIDALMPTDDYGGDAATAHSLGMLQDSPASGPLAQSTSVSGVISTLTDADHFTFIAGATGTVTISAENVTHDLVASWEAWGGSWSVTESGDCVIDVVAGQVYRVGLSSAGGLGYYSLSVSLDADFLPIQSGSVGPQETRTGLSVTGERWYAFTAGATGYFTVESLPQQGSASVAVYDAQQSLLASDNGSGRADAQVSQGDTVLVRVTGDSSDLNLRLTNAVSQSGDAVTL